MISLNKEKIICFIKKNIHYFVYALFILLITYPIFIKSGHIFLIDFFQGLTRYIYVDNSFDVLLKVLNYFLPATIISRILIVFCLFSICLGARSIVSVFTKNRIVMLFLPLFALINPFTYDRFGNGQFYILLGFAFTMFSVSYLLKYFLDINNEKVIFKIINKNFFLFSLFFALSIAASSHFIFLAGIFYLIFILFYFIKNKFSKKNVFEFLLLNCVLLLLIFVLNIAIFVSIFFMKGNMVDFVNSAASINSDQLYTNNGILFSFGSNLVELFFYNLNNSAMFTEVGVNYKSLNLDYNNILLISTFSIVFLLFLFGIKQSLSKYRNKSYLFLFLIFLFLLSLVLSFGNGFCFDKIANITYSYIPFFKGMREPTKFNLDMCVIYLIFISIAVDYMFNKFKTKKTQYLMATILVLIFFLRAPYLLFGFWGQFKIYDYPREWYNTDKYLKDELKCDGKMLFLPFEDYINMNIDKENMQERNVVYNFMSRFFSCDVITGVSNSAFTNMSADRYKMIVDIKNSLAERYNGVYTNFLGDLKKYDIKYIILSNFYSVYSYNDIIIKNTDLFELLKENKYFSVYRFNY